MSDILAHPARCWVSDSAREGHAHGLAIFTIDVPNDPTLVGTAIFTQAWIRDLNGVAPDALSNAQDVVVQSVAL